MMSLEERARHIAQEADNCCNRGGTWEENIYKIALTMLEEAIADRAPLTEQDRINMRGDRGALAGRS